MEKMANASGKNKPDNSDQTHILLSHSTSWIKKGFSGGVAQLGERYVRNVQARGSNPLISTIF